MNKKAFLKIIFLTIIIFLFSVAGIYSQKKSTDSLVNILKNETDNDNRINILLSLSKELRNNYPDSALLYAKESLELSKLSNNKNAEANSYYNIGYIYKNKGEFNEAITFLQKALEINLKSADEEEIAKTYNLIGISYDYKGDFEKALEYYFKALHLNEKANNKKEVAKNYNNIGIVYDFLKDYDNSLEYHFKSLKIKKELKDSTSIAYSLYNIASVYFYQGKEEKARTYIDSTITILKKTTNLKLLASIYTNIGMFYGEGGKNTKAKEYFEKAYNIHEKLGDINGQALSLNNIGQCFYFGGQYNEATKYYYKSLKLSIEIDAKPNILDAYKNLFKVYDATFKHDSALKYYIFYSDYKDTILNEKKQNQITELNTKYQTEKKQQEIEKQKLKIAKDEAVIKKKNTQRNALIIGFIIISVFLMLVIRLLVQKKKANALLSSQKKEIENINEELFQTNEELNATLETINIQKEEIEAQNEEIIIQRDQVTKQKEELISSINYAKCIQDAVLPSDERISEILQEHFILFEPRDIVSGDFYWIKQIDNYTVVATADCTGHGVPGAFMSMLGNSFLNEIVTSLSIKNSGEILNNLREKVKTSLKQTGKKAEQKDGMDIAFYIINNETKELQFSGAYNPLYIIRPDKHNTKDNNGELITLKADRQPIAIHIKEEKFNTQKFQLEKGDCLYTFSDGYIDQFGGERGHKYKPINFQNLLFSIYQKPMHEQKQILINNFNDWRGSYKQIDDILIIGVRV